MFEVMAMSVPLCVADMGSHSTRPQKNTCLSGEVSARHYWTNLVEQAEK